MKKTGIAALAAVFLLFLFFTAGFFFGRNFLAGEVLVTRIPTAETLPPETQPPVTEAPVVFPVDLNTAGMRELTALPGIGEVLAQRILDFRTAHRGFHAIEELELIEGIGKGRMEALLPCVTIGGTNE